MPVKVMQDRSDFFNALMEIATELVTMVEDAGDDRDIKTAVGMAEMLVDWAEAQAKGEEFFNPAEKPEYLVEMGEEVQIGKYQLVELAEAVGIACSDPATQAQAASTSIVRRGD
jgi:hypothetical protein